ncbi:BQ5605_C004g03037 [Microbotryum silenes-dioicae]|uniref:BQ5605_C004g03037 protein n=1 Tax=Microbotryum silenes-dioicae TaxID=796604 RepID=A0A2X0MDN9_9BASI|nr:BQ5605_C004g03037 [Microbotryum silenes-dioicae]
MSRIPLPSSPSIQINGTPTSKDTSTGSVMSSSSASYLNSPSSRVGAGAGTRASSSDAGLADTRKRVSKKDEVSVTFFPSSWGRSSGRERGGVG